MFCREQAARYAERQGDFDDLGVRVVAIGNGTPAMARDFAQRFEVRFDLFTDPGRKSYEAAGLKHGVLLRPKVFASAARAALRGHFQGRTRGDALQQGGLLAIGHNGEVLISHVDDTAGDHVPVDEVLAAFRRNAEAVDSAV